jgi:hypothetical protein
LRGRVTEVDSGVEDVLRLLIPCGKPSPFVDKLSIGPGETEVLGFVDVLSRVVSTVNAGCQLSKNSVDGNSNAPKSKLLSYGSISGAGVVRKLVWINIL